MQYARQPRAARDAASRATRRAPPSSAPSPNGTTRRSSTRILELRREAAKLLGYRQLRRVSLVPKMASTPDEVLAFLRDLARRAQAVRRARLRRARDVRARRARPRRRSSRGTSPTRRRSSRTQRYAFSEQEVRQYFPEDKVLAGPVPRRRDALRRRDPRGDSAATWHPTVRFFEIRDRDGALVGQFYLDLYARAGKQGGAWMDDADQPPPRRRRACSIPVAYLTCNFAAPVGRQARDCSRTTK